MTQSNPTRTRCKVRLDQLNLMDGRGKVREGILDPGWIKDLALGLKNRGRLDSILLWRDPKRPAEEPFVVLDGRHRIAAYRSAKRTTGIPAEIITTADFARALAEAAKGHAKGQKPLTPGERHSMSWRIVLEDSTGMSRREIAEATGNSEGLIAKQRRRKAELERRGVAEITGSWWRDQSDRRLLGEDETVQGMTDGQRAAAIKEKITEVRNVLDWRKGSPVLRDQEAVFEIIAGAIGWEAMRAFLGFAFPGEDDEATTWASIPAGEDMADDPLEGLDVDPFAIPAGVHTEGCALCTGNETLERPLRMA